MPFTNAARPPGQLPSGTYTDGTPYVDFQSTSRWGITIAGQPYYDSAGADSADSAIPEYNINGTTDLFRSLP